MNRSHIHIEQVTRRYNHQGVASDSVTVTFTPEQPIMVDGAMHCATGTYISLGTPYPCVIILDDRETVAIQTEANADPMLFTVAREAVAHRFGTDDILALAEAVGVVAELEVVA